MDALGEKRRQRVRQKAWCTTQQRPKQDAKHDDHGPTTSRRATALLAFVAAELLAAAQGGLAVTLLPTMTTPPSRPMPPAAPRRGSSSPPAWVPRVRARALHAARCCARCSSRATARCSASAPVGRSLRAASARARAARRAAAAARHPGRAHAPVDAALRRRARRGGVRSRALRTGARTDGVFHSGGILHILSAVVDAPNWLLHTVLRWSATAASAIGMSVPYSSGKRRYWRCRLCHFCVPRVCGYTSNDNMGCSVLLRFSLWRRLSHVSTWSLQEACAAVATAVHSLRMYPFSSPQPQLRAS